MTITFENDNDVKVYALKKIISYPRENQYIFLAQIVWWISSVIGLQQKLVIRVDNLRKELEIPAQGNRRLAEATSDQSIRQVSTIP